MPRGKVRERDGVYRRKDRPGWWVSFVDARGIRRREKVEGHTRPQALTTLAAIRTRVQQERILGVREQSDISTSDLFGRYQQHQKARLRPSSYERTKTILKTLKAAIPPRAKDITRNTVAQLIDNRSEEIRPATLSKEITTLKHALRLAVEWGLLNSNVAAGAKLPKISQGKTRYLSPTELKAALGAAPEWMRAPIALAAFTGCRRGELLSLKWADVDLEKRRLYLHETKNGDLRVLVVNDLALAVLNGLPQDHILVLPGVDAQLLSVQTKRVFAKVGIKDASFHTLRHTAASWLAMKGVDLYVIGGILGHRTPRMTARYAHLSPHYTGLAIAKLDVAFAGVLPADESPLVTAESPRLEARNAES